MSLSAQTLEVKSFYEEQLPDGTIDISARVAGAKDDNGKPCALIKIKTVEHIFVDGLVPCAEIKYKIGEADIYIYHISNDMYHTAKGEFVISPDSTTTLDISLKPNFGYIKVNSTPEAAATVRINNSSAGKTPYTSDRLRSGVYTVSVFKAMYQSATQEVSVTDGETSAVTLAMTPDFAEPVITCSDPNAEIWVNGEKKGVGSWNHT